jgi:hypothetical protein
MLLQCLKSKQICMLLIAPVGIEIIDRHADLRRRLHF